MQKILLHKKADKLVVANKNAVRKAKSCKPSPVQCAVQNKRKDDYIVCYGDGTGFYVHPDTDAEISFGNVPKTKVNLGRAVGIFDPRGTMISATSQVFTSVFGFGSRGDHDCSFSQNNAISDILSSHSLPPIWSLRSVTATGAGRLYLGTSSVPMLHESQQYTSVTQSAGHYSAILSGLAGSGTRARSKSSKQQFSAFECVLDTGVCLVPCAFDSRITGCLMKSQDLSLLSFGYEQ